MIESQDKIASEDPLPPALPPKPAPWPMVEMWLRVRAETRNPDHWSRKPRRPAGPDDPLHRPDGQ